MFFVAYVLHISLPWAIYVPLELIDTCRIGYEEQKEWYFFSHKDKKYPTVQELTGPRWPGFGRPPDEIKQYTIDRNLSEEGWVVCRAFKKRIITQTKSSMLGWDSAYYYQDEPIGVYEITKHKPLNCPAKHLVCKQETDAATETLNLVEYPGQFVQLPELGSPSLMPIKTTSSIAEMRASNEDDYIKEYCKSKNIVDWRDLDRFVASQLSNGDAEYEGKRVSSFEELLKCGGEGEKLNDAISSDCDSGICIFNK
ncbi:NAC domain-containing protein 7 [Dorcoceras hygrometricum]|uniref:NAC domain-containing protein 7 n=1 Tax=Dorcoceras hygrometricum TaxID=472368 RepID=A0A2Z7BSI0_9LAMI|nr:NAC domain-containing protein 7 [Dorcoceras hygrometricum]